MTCSKCQYSLQVDSLINMVSIEQSPLIFLYIPHHQVPLNGFILSIRKIERNSKVNNIYIYKVRLVYLKHGVGRTQYYIPQQHVTMVLKIRTVKNRFCPRFLVQLGFY